MTEIKIYSITIALLFLTACESKGSTGANIMIEKIDDPLDGMTVSAPMRKSMGAEGLIVTYKECTNMSEEGFEGLREAAEEDTEMKSVTKVSKCPTPYAALCESKFGNTYYYSDAKRILDGKKSECVYLKGTWTANTQGKEVVAKMYKATFHMNGTSYTYESASNCNINPINKDIISTPQLSDDATWVKLSANTKKGEQGCMFDFNVNGKHYHAEKCDVNYDGKNLTGKTTAGNIHKHDDNVEITFDIVCE